jgi:hypothetical protein
MKFIAERADTHRYYFSSPIGTQKLTSETYANISNKNMTILPFIDGPPKTFFTVYQETEFDVLPKPWLKQQKRQGDNSFSSCPKVWNRWSCPLYSLLLPGTAFTLQA